MRIFPGKTWVIVAGLTMGLGAAGSSAAADSQAATGNTDALPYSSVENKQIETFTLECPDNAQQNTLDINDCFSVKLAQIEAVNQKYVSAIRKNLEASLSDDDAEHNRRKTLEAFEAENKAWDTLIDKASMASYQEAIGGSIRGMVAASRKLALLETRIHDQWENWLQTMSSSEPPLLPEPRFTSQ